MEDPVEKPILRQIWTDSETSHALVLKGHVLPNWKNLSSDYFKSGRWLFFKVFHAFLKTNLFNIVEPHFSSNEFVLFLTAC